MTDDRFAIWSQDAEREIDYVQLFNDFAFMDTHEMFSDYEPTRFSGPRFSERLTGWLNSAQSEEDQKLLFRLAAQLYFVGRNEFDVLYQEAFSGVIQWWLIDQIGLKFADLTAGRLRSEIQATWFCPVTDSMNIARFYHLHNLEGADLRPTWHALCRLGSEEKVRQHMKRRGYKRIVLLEDFVGTGTQITGAIKFAESLADDIQILACPLILHPDGRVKLESVIDQSKTRLHPVLVLPPSAILRALPVKGEPGLFERYRRLIISLKPYLGQTEDHTPVEEDPAFGYKGNGSLTVLFTNCPNNVPPIVHTTTDSWQALFPRSTRV